MRVPKDFYNKHIGKTYNFLTVLCFARTDTDRPGFLCQCVCGKQVVLCTNHLLSNHTISCGCKKTENNMNRHLTIHGHAAERPYLCKIHWAMIDRCYNESNLGYHRYGGRGIKVCDRWKESVDNLFQDMGDRPSDDLTLERINNDGDYEPSNCKWATMYDQRMNQERMKPKDLIDQNNLTK